ncbi:MAG: hypothetical protein J6R60_04695, partial [Clostridia bacterium]|nr:hypothetical protein [Clostridia bacterium]
MTERIIRLKKFFVDEKKHNQFRRSVEYDKNIIDSIGKQKTHRAMANLLCAVLEMEEPLVFDFERFSFTRTVKNIPYEALDPFLEGKKIHEKGIINNICVDY